MLQTSTLRVSHTEADHAISHHPIEQIPEYMVANSCLERGISYLIRWMMGLLRTQMRFGKLLCLQRYHVFATRFSAYFQLSV